MVPEVGGRGFQPFRQHPAGLLPPQGSTQHHHRRPFGRRGARRRRHDPRHRQEQQRQQAGGRAYTAKRDAAGPPFPQTADSPGQGRIQKGRPQKQQPRQHQHQTADMEPAAIERDHPPGEQKEPRRTGNHPQQDLAPVLI